MCDDAGGVPAAGTDGHPERVEHQLGFEVVSHRPADDAAAEDVLDGGEKEEALPGLDVLEIADPEPSGSARAKSRSTRSRAEARFGSRTVVRGPPRLPSAPRIPSCRISLATRFLPTRMLSPSLSSE